MADKQIDKALRYFRSASEIEEILFAMGKHKLTIVEHKGFSSNIESDMFPMLCIGLDQVKVYKDLNELTEEAVIRHAEMDIDDIQKVSVKDLSGFDDEINQIRIKIKFRTRSGIKSKTEFKVIAVEGIKSNHMYKPAGCINCNSGQITNRARTALDITSYNRCKCANINSKSYRYFRQHEQHILRHLNGIYAQSFTNMFKDNNRHIEVGSNATDRSW